MASPPTNEDRLKTAREGTLSEAFLAGWAPDASPQARRAAATSTPSPAPDGAEERAELLALELMRTQAELAHANRLLMLAQGDPEPAPSIRAQVDAALRGAQS
jgi:hypothetical protein